MIEAVVEGQVTKIAEEMGFLSRKMKYIGRTGCRDRDFYGFGHVLLVEFKRPGGPVRKSQQREKARLAAVGVTVYVIDNIEDGITLLKWARKNPRRQYDMA